MQLEKKKKSIYTLLAEYLFVALETLWQFLEVLRWYQQLSMKK